MGGPFTYLIMELVWALPVVALQWAVGRATLWAHRRTLLLGVLIPTAYLSLADAVAIERGIWALSPVLTTNVALLSLPLEETLFFCLTNTMVVQGLILPWAGEPLRARARRHEAAPRVRPSRRAPARAGPPLHGPRQAGFITAVQVARRSKRRWTRHRESDWAARTSAGVGFGAHIALNTADATR